MNKKLFELIRQKYVERLKAKTGWGRVDVLAEYDAAVAEAVMEFIDQQQEPAKV